MRTLLAERRTPTHYPDTAAESTITHVLRRAVALLVGIHGVIYAGITRALLGGETGGGMAVRRSRRTILAAMVMLGSRAEAQIHPDAHGWRLTIDRLLGFQWSSITMHTGSRASTLQQTAVTAFGAYLLPIVPTLTPTPIVPMRIGVDWEFTNHVTLGAALALGWMSVSQESVSQSAFLLGVAPRVGYSLRLSRGVAFWPRAGFTLAYNSVRITGLTSLLSSVSGEVFELSVNLDPTFVFAVSDRFALTAAVVADLPVVGVLSSGGSSRSDSFAKLSFGIQAGVQGRF